MARLEDASTLFHNSSNVLYDVHVHRTMEVPDLVVYFHGL